MIKVTAESFIKNSVLCNELKAVFPDVIFWDRTIPFIDFCADAEALIVGREIIDETFLAQCPRLKMISKYGVGLDNINLEACEKRGIKIGWKAGVNKLSVAELTLAFMLAASHNVFNTGMKLKQGEWNKNGGFQLSGKTVGIIGVGNVGKELIRLLHPFNCKILVNDIIPQTAYYESNNLVESSKNNIFAQADFVSLHVPLTDETHHLINGHSLSQFQPHAALINTCRGEVVDEHALKNALVSNTIAAAYLDVFENEPSPDLGLLQHPNVFCTPHIGGNAWEAVLAMGRSAISHLSYFYGKA